VIGHADPQPCVERRSYEQCDEPYSPAFWKWSHIRAESIYELHLQGDSGAVGSTLLLLRCTRPWLEQKLRREEYMTSTGAINSASAIRAE
jgi:hypothetical protein